jgi:hypothetical protein
VCVRESECVCERERESVCVCERVCERESVCMRRRERWSREVKVVSKERRFQQMLRDSG